MRSGRAGARPGSFSLYLSSRAGSTKRVITVWKREAQRGERKIRSQAHGYMALLVNTMLRKHHGAVQRGHDVSILSSPREASLEGPQGTRCPPPSLSSPLPSRRSSSSRRSPLAALCSPDRAALFAKACRTLRERGTTHRASQITPLSKSPDLQASVYTVQRSHHCSLAERLPSFCVLIFRCLGVVESSVRFAWLPRSPRSFFLVHSLSSDVYIFFVYPFLSSTMHAGYYFLSVLAILHPIRVSSQLSPSGKFLFFSVFLDFFYTYIRIVFSLYLSSSHFLIVIHIKSSAKLYMLAEKKEREIEISQ